MNDRLSLQGILAQLGLLAGMLLVIALFVALDRAGLIIPPPEKTAEQLVSALGAHRFAGARNQLSQDLRSQVEDADFTALVQGLEQSHQGILDVHELDSQANGRNATARVKIKWGDLQEDTLQFPLVKENGLWKVASLGPLRTAASRIVAGR